jgi:hypothetical protein
MGDVGRHREDGDIAEELIMERYMEVIIPLWHKLSPYIEHRQSQKGGGWQYFEKLADRAESYRALRYPGREFRSFVPPSQSLSQAKATGGQNAEPNGESDGAGPGAH